MIFELLYRKDFSEWVDQILLSVDLLRIDIISIHDLSDKIVVT